MAHKKQKKQPEWPPNGEWLVAKESGQHRSGEKSKKSTPSRGRPRFEHPILADAVAKDDRLLTVAEAAAWIGCGRRTLDQMISDRRIPAHLIGGRYRFDKLEVLRETKLSD